VPENRGLGGGDCAGKGGSRCRQYVRPHAPSVQR
jgi:hypothetical protein